MTERLLSEQHFHGCYGINFNTATVENVLFLASKIYGEGVGYIFPTLVTDTIDNIKRQISIIKQASKSTTSDTAKICGVHLEGIFLNPEKKGIHNSNLFMEPTIDNYKLIEDNFIKIVTLAPELAQDGLIDYLKNQGVKVQAGHCIGANLDSIDATTHTFNAMSGINHRQPSTALSALLDDNIYTEIIADGVHVSDDTLRLLFKCKPVDKILLVSDCLPCTHSDVKEFDFAGEKIYFDGNRATSKSGTLAGSTMLLPDIIKLLKEKGLFKEEFVDNLYRYHNVDLH